MLNRSRVKPKHRSAIRFSIRCCRSGTVFLHAFLALGILNRTRSDAAELPVLRHATVVIAHRGEHRMHHENTLEAIRGAIDAGADFAEMDVRSSVDGRYLLMHDGTVDRMTDGKGRVSDLPWDTLSKLTVRDKRLPQVAPSRIPLFEEALQTCKGRIHIYLDFKAGDRKTVAGLVHAAGMDRQVIVYDGSVGIAEWHRVAPELPIITSPPSAALTNKLELKAFVSKYHPEAFDEAPDAGFTADAGALGVRPWPDIQKETEGPSYWKSIWAMGIRGFQTDHPVELVHWLEQEGLR